MTKKQPAFQFYTGDWLKDPQLSMCCPATRGIWIDLLSAMHENNRSGQIAGTTEQLARICRCTAVEFVQAIDELKNTNTAIVTERNGKVTVVNRRMKKESDERKSNKERVLRYRRRKKRKDDPDCNAKVTPPSSSSSSTSVRKSSKKEKCDNNFSSEFDYQESAESVMLDSNTIDWKLTQLWNSFAEKPVKGMGFTAVEREVRQILNETEVSFEQLKEAVKNYRKARKIKDTQAGNYLLPNFLKRIRKGKTNYLPGYFDPKNFNQKNFENSGKKKSVEEIVKGIK